MTEIESEVILTALRLLEIKTESSSDSFNETEIRVLLMALRLWQIKREGVEAETDEELDAMDLLAACEQNMPLQSNLSPKVIQNLIKVIMEIQS